MQPLQVIPPLDYLGHTTVARAREVVCTVRPALSLSLATPFWLRIEQSAGRRAGHQLLLALPLGRTRTARLPVRDTTYLAVRMGVPVSRATISRAERRMILGWTQCSAPWVTKA